MKKLILLVCLLWVAVCLPAQEKVVEADGPAECSLPQEQSPAPSAPETDKQRKKRFTARRKEMRKLVKKYRKAATEQKTEIKERLAAIVSEATDEGLAWSKQRIAAERANLNAWEQRIKADEKDLVQAKARRVDEILSGEAQHRYKLAKKRWKKEMKDRKKAMN